VNALANAEVGKSFKTHFIASYQKIGTFRVEGKQKQGGNVASYFCTADGRVIHVVAGPVNADVLLREARWAVETWKLAQLTTRESNPELQVFMRNAHAARLRLEHGLDLRKPAGVMPNGTPVAAMRVFEQPRFQTLSGAGRVHMLLAAAPLIQIGRVYAVVFEKVLDERVSILPVDVADPR
jgi:hypothetical protein